MYRYSIRTKLVFFLGLSSVIALIIASSSYLVHYYYHDKETVVQNSIKLAKVSGKNIAASLMFQDKESTNMILEPILNDKDVKYIVVYDNDANYFTSIGDRELNQNNFLKKDFLNYEDVNIFANFHYIDVLTKITHSGEDIGFLEITSTTDSIKDRMLEQIAVSLIIIFITILIMIILAFWLEKIFSKPIFDLLNAMRSLKDSSNFDTRLVPYTQDEFHELFIEFNSMVNEISKRDKVLKDHNIDLKLQVNTTSEQLKTTQDDLEQVSILATTDVLTNLPNRRHTMDKFDEMIEDAYNAQEYLGLIMLDIDHFKLVNDNLGHHAGDVVIREIADILNKNGRENDVAGRIGGEEFLVLCKHSDTKTTFDVAERLRKKVEEKVISYEDGKTVQVKISLGVYSSIPTLTKEELIKIADEALYNAKNTGRNRVSIGVES